MIEFPLRPGGSAATHRAGATFLGRIGGNAVEDAAPRLGKAAGADSVAAGAFRLVAPNIGPPWSAWTVPGLDGASTLLAAAAVVPSQSERRAVVSGRFDRSPRSSRSTVVSLLRSDVLHRWIAVGAGFGSAGASLKDDGSIEVFAADAGGAPTGPRRALSQTTDQDSPPATSSTIPAAAIRQRRMDHEPASTAEKTPGSASPEDVGCCGAAAARICSTRWTGAVCGDRSVRSRNAKADRASSRTDADRNAASSKAPRAVATCMPDRIDASTVVTLSASLSGSGTAFDGALADCPITFATAERRGGAESSGRPAADGRSHNASIRVAMSFLSNAKYSYPLIRRTAAIFLPRLRRQARREFAASLFGRACGCSLPAGRARVRSPAPAPQ